MKARVKATGEIWEFSQIDEITFKSAINGHLYCADELEFLMPSPFTPDYWERLTHQYAGMIVQGMVEHNGINFINDAILNVAVQKATALVEKLKNNNQ